MNTVPEVLGDFELLEELGRGGMGGVYRARQRSLDRVVAVKVLPPEMAQEGRVAERFAAEAQRMARLNDHNVAQVYLVGEQDGVQYFAMQYLPGGSLEDRLQAGPMDLPAALEIAAQVAEALEVAHRQGLVHRDIKPANILFDERGQAVVTDFGIAKAGDEVRFTVTGVAVGTPQYMSPEQARGNPVDHRADLYALGVVLYEMLCGRPPFAGETPVSVAMKHVNDAPVAPSLLCAGLPTGVEGLILRAMAKEPADRFTSAAEMAAALRGALQRVHTDTLSPAAPQPGGIRGGDGGTQVVRIEPVERTRPLLIAGLVFALIGVLCVAGYMIVQMRNSGSAKTAKRATDPTTVGGVVAGGGGGAGSTATIPLVVGRMVAEAGEMLRSCGFDFKENEPDFSDAPAGQVIRQHPPAGTRQEPGDAVYIAKSLGPLPPEARSSLAPTYQAWLRAWQSRNFNDFLSYYADDVEVKRRNKPTQNRDDVARGIAASFQKNSYINIISEPPNVSFNGGSAELSAQQKYESNTYWDVGIKHLTWRYRNGQWKIISESFDFMSGGGR